MRPIQTEYRGFRFRSRLEARWAVFLDALNADWTYEVEGFDLDGIWYLPDFWVRDWDTWIEIKGPTPTDDEEEKCDSLARHSGKKVLLLHGDPWSENDKNKYNIVLFNCQGHLDERTSGWQFGEGRVCSEEIWLLSDEHGALTLKPVPHARDEKYPLSGSFAGNIMAALAAARAARFEHGAAV
jgi:hypothetical protein